VRELTEHRARCDGRDLVKGLMGLPESTIPKGSTRVDTTDAQPSNDSGGILVMVTGALMVRWDLSKPSGNQFGKQVLIEECETGR